MKKAKNMKIMKNIEKDERDWKNEKDKYIQLKMDLQFCKIFLTFGNSINFYPKNKTQH